jgi:uncharacterized protein (TIGR03663 family)
MKSTPAYVVALLAVLGLAAALRLPALGERPMHADESVHAFKFRDVYERGDYVYDPNEFHGPTLYYATAVVWKLRGSPNWLNETEPDYRLVTVLFALAGIALLALLGDGLGRRATLAAALLLACSPVLVYYSRQYIQETPFVCFTLGFLGCGWRFTRTRGRGWLLGAGLFAGLMWASKETAALSFAAAGAAWLLTARPWRRDGERVRVPWPAVAGAVAIALGVTFLLLSGLGRHPRAVVDLAAAYLPWLRRVSGGGEGQHVHPFLYYLTLLAYAPRGGHLVHGPKYNDLLTVIGGAAGLILVLGLPKRLPRDADAALARFVGWYTLLLLLAYSALPYKTPWCALSFVAGFALLGGLAAIAAIDAAPTLQVRLGATGVLLILAIVLGRQAWRLNTFYANDTRSAYAYAQTGSDMADFAAPIEALQKLWRGPEPFVVKVFAPDPYFWPVPWYLRRIENVGYWADSRLPDGFEAPVIVAWAPFEDQIEQTLDETHLLTEHYQLRRGTFIEVFVRKDLWHAYTASRGSRRPDDGQD